MRAQKQPSFLWSAIRGFVGALLTSFLIAALAVPAKEYALGFLAPGLTSWEYGGITAAVIFATGLVFNQFDAWHHFLPHLSIAGLLYDEGRCLTWLSVLRTLICMAGSLGGYFIGHAIAMSIVSFDISGASTLTNVTFGPDFYFEFIGMLLICHVFLFSSREFWGVWGVVGIAVLQGALIAAFGPVTGGSFNFWRTLAVGALEGNLGATGWGAKLLATFVAPILTVIIKMLLYSSTRVY